MVIIECFVQYTTLLVKVVHLTYVVAIENAEDLSQF